MTEQEETLRKAISYCIEFYDNKEATSRIMQFIKDDRALQLLKTEVSSTDCKHDFREFWKTNYYGLLKLKEIKCIYCNEKKI